ncbi:hypothetical protein [Streptomyces sp. NPDC002133]|uniref:hypothetical protein n=1 Tax=Streptomyces sp. NPDC002133 TaxID=3154409 RepID=UPI00332A8176
MSLIRAELRRLLRHPLALVLAVLFAMGSLYCAWVSQDSASWNIEQVELNLGHIDEICTSNNTAEQKARCEADLPHQVAGLERRKEEFLENGARAAFAQHPVGALLWTAKLLTSIPGLTLLVLLAAFSVAGEWSRGSIVQLLLQEGRLVRLLAAKVCALWAWMMLLLALSAGATAGFGILYSSDAYPLPSPGSAGSVLADTATGVAGASLVLAGGAAFAVALASMVRLPLRTFLSGLLVLAIVVRTSSVTGIGAWLPGAALADLVGFGGMDSVWDHFWVSTAPSPAPALLRALPTVAGIGLMWWWLHRRSLTRDRI